MARYELSLSTDYVSHWGLAEAVRELFQNGLDQEVQSPSNKFSYKFVRGNLNTETLVLSNKESKLTKASLLLGSTTKSGDAKTIGNFGEGYKLALLVLARSGYDVRIYNYALKETWIPKIIKSRRYDSNLLVIDTTKSIFKKPNQNLTIEIPNLAQSHIKLIMDSIMQFQQYRSYGTEYGQILTEARHKGKLFVGGLFIQDKAELAYGYNFNPSLVTLDRDRRLLQDWDIFYSTSRMWENLDTYEALKLKLVLDDIPDVKYMCYTGSLGTATGVAKAFYVKHGDNAVPVSSQEELEEISTSTTGCPIVVSDNVKNIVRSSIVYKKPELSEKLKQEPKTVLQDFYNAHRSELSLGSSEKLRAIIKQSTTWVVKTIKDIL